MIFNCHFLGSNNGCSTSDIFLWGQSMLIISDLLTTRLLSVHELDPIRRHLPSYNRPKTTNRYSAFEVGNLYFRQGSQIDFGYTFRDMEPLKLLIESRYSLSFSFSNASIFSRFCVGENSVISSLFRTR